jgi:hypothetical protein
MLSSLIRPTFEPHFRQGTAKKDTFRIPRPRELGKLEKLEGRLGESTF